MGSEVDKRILFKCKHCDNDDMRYFLFHSLEYQSDAVKNSPYRQNWNRETSPKIPIGFHLLCAKCNKDTFIIPNDYQPTTWGNDVPQQCIVNVVFEKPQFSSINYVLTEDGFLDQVVTTANNEMLSMITKEMIGESVNFNTLGKPQYELLLKRGLKEVSVKVEPSNNNSQKTNNRSDK